MDVKLYFVVYYILYIFNIFQLIKLERVSHKEGVKTVISDVCFAYLTRMEPRDVTKLRHGLLPLIQFPIKLKKTKIKVSSKMFGVSSLSIRK